MLGIARVSWRSVGDLVAARVAKHVTTRLDAQIGRDHRPVGYTVKRTIEKDTSKALVSDCASHERDFDVDVAFRQPPVCVD